MPARDQCAPIEPDGDSYPAWSPDGKSIAYRQGGDPKLIEYATDTWRVVSGGGGSRCIL